MKKLGLILVALVLAVATITADDRIISAEKLPQKAKDFIAANFAGKTVQYVEKDFNEYEVQLSDRAEITFKGNGEWENIKSYEGLPASILPAAVGTYLTSNFADAKIVEVEKDWNRIEVKLSTRMEVYFDKDGKFLGQKFDD
ncbi:MAG: PepSY-like domain-containing protein [Treponema sp.]|nr:PepSY-like domain-containing protein [Treponema sp.]